MSIFNRKYKDSVFTDLFGSDRDGKKNFLELYNGLSGSDYKYGETQIERREIPQTLYKSFNNDVSMVIDGKLIVLVEHQSTINENMPLRCLEYVTRIYEGIIPSDTRYAERVRKIPTPDFYVVYVGRESYPKEKELHLSDAFHDGTNPKLELKVVVKNCSQSQELPLQKNCDILKQYCCFVETVEKHLKQKRSTKVFKAAIEECIENGILAEYLKRKSSEVINMLCAKYSYKTDMKVRYQEGFEAGLEKGVSQGIARGEEAGRRQKAIEATKNLLMMNLGSYEQIAKASGLSLEEVQNLADEMKN